MREPLRSESVKLPTQFGPRVHRGMRPFRRAPSDHAILLATPSCSASACLARASSCVRRDAVIWPMLNALTAAASIGQTNRLSPNGRGPTSAFYLPTCAPCLKVSTWPLKLNCPDSDLSCGLLSRSLPKLTSSWRSGWLAPWPAGKGIVGAASICVCCGTKARPLAPRPWPVSTRPWMLR